MRFKSKQTRQQTSSSLIYNLESIYLIKYFFSGGARVCVHMNSQECQRLRGAFLFIIIDIGPQFAQHVNQI